MGTYKLKEDIVWGFLPDTNGKPNIIFKKGDIIQGDEKEIFVYNQMTKGVSAKPTVEGARVETADGLAFSPLTNLEKISESTTIAVQYKTPTQLEPVSDLKYYTSANFLKRASVSIVPVALIGVYSYNKKLSLLKSALLVSIPIVAITGLQYIFMGGGKNSYWGIFIPPSIRENNNARLREIEKATGMPQKGFK
jgi:hypothetical protein